MGNETRLKGYLYSLWSGQLKVYEGEVVENWRHEGVFITKSKNMGCSIKPTIVYNASVWLSERDDVLAKVILIDYEECEIARLQEKIENHQNKINMLKGEK